MNLKSFWIYLFLCKLLVFISANRKLQRVASDLLHLIPAIGRILCAQYVRGSGGGKLPQVQGEPGEGGEGQKGCKKSQKDGQKTQKYGESQLQTWFVSILLSLLAALDWFHWLSASHPITRWVNDCPDFNKKPHSRVLLLSLVDVALFLLFLITLSQNLRITD